MNSRTKRSLIARGIPTDLIDRITLNNHTLGNIRSFSRRQLRQYYSNIDASLLEQKVKRQPIEEEVVERILTASKGVCAYCKDGNSARPYHIHHIEYYSASQDNSEDNLLLVCPTHHVCIHKTALSVEMQKQTRREWYAVAEIGVVYSNRGVQFPYGVFEPIDYFGEPEILEILRSVPPSARTAVELSNHALGREVCQRLASSRFLLIVGGSGSGKSTLALGVAGASTFTEARVFRYRRPPVGDTRYALNEVLTFMSIVICPCVLILDDANGWASPSDLERIAAAASHTIAVLATWTGGQLDDNATAELHIHSERVLIGWDDLRPALFATLLRYESEIIEVLQSLRPNDVTSVGFGPTQRSLHALLRRYEKSATSIWQFLFLLRGGWESTRDDLAMLIQNDRADLPVLYAAIEQIADVERPVTIEETVEVTNGLMASVQLPNPTSEWISMVFSSLVERRLMVKVRRAYTTVHRDWARALICAALGDSRTQTMVTQLLQKDFNLDMCYPRRLMILWSWLQWDTHGYRFLYNWADQQGPENWALLIGEATRGGLVDLGLVASRLSQLSPNPRWQETLASAFETHQEIIAELVASAGPEDWYSLKDIFTTINHAHPDCAAYILSNWSPDSAADTLARTHPDYYEWVTWFLSGARKHSYTWCDEVGHHVTWEVLSACLSHARQGDAVVADRCVEICHGLGIPLRRSMVHQLVDVMIDALRDAPISEINFGYSPLRLWLEPFQEEMRRIVDALDPRRLGGELSTTSPRYWRTLQLLSGFAERAGSQFGRELVDNLDASFISTVQRHGASNPYMLRCLLWQLTHGSICQRRAFAADLYPVVSNACRMTNPSERQSILMAYQMMDEDCAGKLSRELGYNIPNTDGIDSLNQPLVDILPLLRERLAELEASGEDYEIDMLWISDCDDTSEDVPETDVR